MGAIASQITSLTIVYSIVYSGADQIKHQSSASLAFVWGINRRPMNFPRKWPVTRKMFPFDDVIMTQGWEERHLFSEFVHATSTWKLFGVLVWPFPSKHHEWFCRYWYIFQSILSRMGTLNPIKSHGHFAFWSLCQIFKVRPLENLALNVIHYPRHDSEPHPDQLYMLCVIFYWHISEFICINSEITLHTPWLVAYLSNINNLLSVALIFHRSLN